MELRSALLYEKETGKNARIIIDKQIVFSPEFLLWMDKKIVKIYRENDFEKLVDSIRGVDFEVRYTEFN